MTAASTPRDSRVEIMARVEYEQRNSDPSGWESEAENTQNLWRKRAVITLAALEASGYEVTRLEEVTRFEAYVVGSECRRDELDEPSALYRKLLPQEEEA